MPRNMTNAADISRWGCLPHLSYSWAFHSALPIREEATSTWLYLPQMWSPRALYSFLPELWRQKIRLQTNLFADPRSI
uniref:Uncharacterized protein n=1 Tax=Arundo donax TaxID=35708 RepID=A0A0A9CPP3_ARUDO